MNAKQVIVIRKDLNMRRGKEITQGAHASIAFLLKGGAIDKSIIDDWLNGGQTKICVCVNSEDELMGVYSAAIDSGIEVNLIVDSGRTEFYGIPTKTCLALGPDDSEKINKITGELKLY